MTNSNGPKPKLVISVPLLADEWRTLKLAANTEGMALSAYMRACALREARKLEHKLEVEQ